MPISKGKRLFWTCLLILVCLVSLWVPFYNHVEPSIGGIPFFYWFQFCWIIVVAIVTALAYRARV